MKAQKGDIAPILGVRDCLTLVGLTAVGFGWLQVDQWFLPESYQRFIALIIVAVGLVYLQFLLNRPRNPKRYTHAVAGLLLGIVIVISVIQHIIVKRDFSPKVLLVWAITATIAYVAGYLYQLKRRT